MSDEKIVISASKLDSFESCSWAYWCRYGLKMPSSSNIGAIKGTVCHAVFEHIITEKRQKYVDQIKEEKTCKNIPAIWRYINNFGKKEGLFDPEHFVHVDEMVYNAIKEGDFIPDRKKYDIVTEEQFEIPIGNNVYILGYIDKKIINKKTQEVQIRDYKSSKERFAPKKIKNNFQGMVYTLAEYKKTKQIPEVCFWFLQFPNNIRQVMPKVTEIELLGFEHYLRSVGETMRHFNSDFAKLNFAKHKPKPSKDEGFTGCLKCGFAKHKGQLKKDGSKMWHCEYKFNEDYYVIYDEDGNIKHKSFNRNDLLKHNKEITKLHYKGCPAHQ